MIQNFLKKINVARCNADFFFLGNIKEDIPNSIMDLKYYDSLLSFYNPSHLKISKGSKNIKENNFIQDTHKNIKVDPKKLTEYLDNGYSIILNSFHEYSSSIKKLCHLIEKNFNVFSGCNAYFTPRNSQAFLPHYDTHDVLVLQISGTKEWLVYQDKFPTPTKETPYQLNNNFKGTIQKKLTLHQGDCIYIPRGQFHEAFSTNTNSMHLSISIVDFTLYDFLSKIFLSEKITNEKWRKSIDISNIDYKEITLILQKRLSSILTPKNINWAEKELKKVHEKNKTKELLHPFSSFNNDKSFSLDDTIYLNPKVNKESILYSNSSISIETEEWSVQLPLILKPIFPKLLSNKKFKISEIFEPYNLEALEIVQKLINAKVLVLCRD